MTALWLLLSFFWALPVLVAHTIGQRRNRTGWVYGFMLGWLGVLIVSCTSYLPSKAEIRLREVEAKRQLGELHPTPEPAGPRQIVQTPIFGWPKELKPSTYKRD